MKMRKMLKIFFAKVSDFLLCLDKCNNTLLAPFGVEIDLQTEQLEFGSLRNKVKENKQSFKQTSTTRGIFTIKKPDLAGSSQWEIIGDRVLKVKIDDKNFLQKLKNRDILIGFGERIEATLITNTLIDKDNLGIL